MNAERTPSSDSFLPSAAVENFAAPHESGHSLTWWALACLTAIIMGVIPALLINHYRNAPAPQQAQRVLAPPAPAPQLAPSPPPPAPATASSDTPAVVPTVPTIEMDEDKPVPGHTTDHVRHPPAHPPKRPPPCDVYLHPHGCPH